MQRHFFRCLTPFIIPLSALIALPAMAVEKENINFSGFTTLGYGKALDDNGHLVGFSEDGEYRDFNRLGFRMDANLQENVSFAAQMTASGINDYNPEFEWIYANINLHEYIDARVGRMRIPLFAYSDFLDVGYAYPWISPPDSVYADAPSRSYEGISLIYSQPIGIFSSTLQLFGGETEEDLNLPQFKSTLTLEDLKGFAWTLNYDWLQLRASYSGSTSSGDLSQIDDLKPLLTLFQAIDTQIGGNFMDDILWEDDEAYFAGLGVTLDFETVFFIAEKTHVRNTESLTVGDVDSYYLTTGIRPIENWTFALTFAKDKDEAKKNALKAYNKAAANYNALNPLGSDNLAILAPPTGNTPPINGIPDFIELATVGGILDNASNAVMYNNDDTFILNARWDFHPRAAAKFEYLRKRDRTAEKVLDASSKLGKASDSDGFRVALDLVF